MHHTFTETDISTGDPNMHHTYEEIDLSTGDPNNMHHTYTETDLTTADPIWSKMKKYTVIFAIGFIICVTCGGIAAYFIASASANHGK